MYENNILVKDVLNHLTTIIFYIFYFSSWNKNTIISLILKKNNIQLQLYIYNIYITKKTY